MGCVKPQLAALPFHWKAKMLEAALLRATTPVVPVTFSTVESVLQVFKPMAVVTGMG